VNPQGTALVYSGYIGGASCDMGNGIAVDAGGHAYVAGMTQSNEATFPVRIGPDLTYNGNGDAFVAKVQASGASLVYCGYVGGQSYDVAEDIALDPMGNAYLIGWTDSTETQGFPLKVGPELKHHANLEHAFVAKVNAAGRALDYCGYLGKYQLGLYGDTIAVDGAGNAYAGCRTQLYKVNPTGSGYVYSANWSFASIAVDSIGQVYGTGLTGPGLPARIGPDLTYNGQGPTQGYDAYVAMTDVRASQFLYCGYIGGLNHDQGEDIAIDTFGSAFVVGWTLSTESTFPDVGGPDLTFNGTPQTGSDGFIAKVTATYIQAGGTPRPGSTIALSVVSTIDAGRAYQVGSSLGRGPIRFGQRRIELSPDGLLAVSVSGQWPWVFSGYRGVLDSQGQAKAAINIPNVPALIGLRLHSAFVTLDPAAPSGIRSISNTFTFSVTK